MILLDIWKGVVGYLLINISPSNIFLSMLLPAKFWQLWVLMVWENKLKCIANFHLKYAVGLKTLLITLQKKEFWKNIIGGIVNC